MLFRTVHVSIGRELVRFAKADEVLALNAAVYFDQRQPPRILSVGEVPSAGGGIEVRLFDGHESTPDKAMVLEVFFRFGLRKISGGRFSLAPRVTVDIEPEVVAVLGGYHRMVIHRALVGAGAASTPFEKEFGGL